jgi:hypothetical protein
MVYTAATARPYLYNFKLHYAMTNGTGKNTVK